MGIGGIISAIVVGIVLGFLGRLVAPGRQNIPIWLTIIVGIAAAFIGTWLASLFGWNETPGIDWLELIMQIVVAAIGVTIAAQLWGRSRAVQR